MDTAVTNKNTNDLNKRILHFFNRVTDPNIICDTILDDPLFGKSVPSGIQLTTAKNIIKCRNQQPNKRFTSLEQLDEVKGVGLGSIHNIIYTFLVKRITPVYHAVEVIFEKSKALYFDAVMNLESTFEVAQRAEIGNSNLYKEPGATDYKSIIFKGGHSPVCELWEWKQHLENGVVEKRNGLIRIRNKKGIDVAQFQFYNSWPSRIRCGFDEDSIERAITIEEFELIVEKWMPSYASLTRSEVKV